MITLQTISSSKPRSESHHGTLSIDSTAKLFQTENFSCYQVRLLWTFIQNKINTFECWRYSYVQSWPFVPQNPHANIWNNSLNVYRRKSSDRNPSWIAKQCCYVNSTNLSSHCWSNHYKPLLVSLTCPPSLHLTVKGAEIVNSVLRNKSGTTDIKLLRFNSLFAISQWHYSTIICSRNALMYKLTSS